MSSPPIIGAAVSARGLMKRYEQGRIVALDGLDLDIAAGEFVALCGPSGCGKSTLLNMLAAIDRPDAGQVQVDGQAIGGFTDAQATAYRASCVGLVFQLHNLLPNLTALENIQLSLMPTNRYPAHRLSRAADLLSRVGLGDRAAARPPVLSGGERQRIAIARSIANRPRLLLADEPTGSLDSRTGDQIISLLNEIRAESGMTLIVVTHDEHIAQRAGRVIHMLDGRIVSSTDQ